MFYALKTKHIIQRWQANRRDNQVPDSEENYRRLSVLRSTNTASELFYSYRSRSGFTRLKPSTAFSPGRI